MVSVDTTSGTRVLDLCQHSFRGPDKKKLHREIGRSSNSKRSGKVMKLRFFVSLALMSAVVAVPAKAHHSFNTFFDMSRTVAIEGVVTSFRLVSPHSEMLVDVPDAGGKPVTWRITARTGAVNAKREGWKVEDFIGKKVKVEGNPTRREGGTAMAAGVVTFADSGKVVCLGGCPGGPPVE
jgi:hypothetical protein